MRKTRKIRVATGLLLVLMFLTGCSSSSTQADQSYVGSINSDKYHYPDCRWAGNIKPENEIWFSNTGEAEEQGYVPCKTCQP